MNKKDKEQFEKWIKDSVARNAPKMRDSSVFASIVTKNYLEAPECALQLGLAILMDKPIMLIVDKDMKIPGNLAKIAKVIERVDMDNPADMARAAKSIAALAEQQGDNDARP